jgi:hypothetical protein
MRSKVLCVLVFLMFITAGLLQAEELSQTCEVTSSQQQSGEFEAALKDLRAIQARFQGPVNCCEMVFRTKDYHYFFFTRIDNMAALDDYFGYYERIAQDAGKDWTDLIERFAGTFQSQTMGTFILRDDLSLNPRALTSGGIDAIEMDFYYVKSGKMSQFEDMARSWQSMTRTKNVKGGYNVLAAQMWSELPLYIVIRHGGDGDQLSRSFAAKAMNVCRKIDHKSAQLMNDLSFRGKAPKQRRK